MFFKRANTGLFFFSFCHLMMIFPKRKILFTTDWLKTARNNQLEIVNFVVRDIWVEFNNIFVESSPQFRQTIRMKIFRILFLSRLVKKICSKNLKRKREIFFRNGFGNLRNPFRKEVYLGRYDYKKSFNWAERPWSTPSCYMVKSMYCLTFIKNND